RQPTPRAAAPNASDFVELYAFERPAPPLPVDDFVDELKTLVCEHPVEPALAEALKYGGGRRGGGGRWLKGDCTVHPRDAQGEAAPVGRRRRRGFFRRLPPLGTRKTASHRGARPPLELFLRFAAALGGERDELEAHLACPETMQAPFPRLHFQFSSFEEGFVV